MSTTFQPCYPEDHGVTTTNTAIQNEPYVPGFLACSGSEGHYVRLAPGTYRTSLPWSFDGPVRLEGAGMKETAIYYSGTSGAAITIGPGAYSYHHGSIVGDFSIHYTGSTASEGECGALNFSAGYRGIVRRVKVAGVGTEWNTGIVLNDCHYCRVEDVDIGGCWFGLLVGGDGDQHNVVLGGHVLSCRNGNLLVESDQNYVATIDLSSTDFQTQAALWVMGSNNVFSGVRCEGEFDQSDPFHYPVVLVTPISPGRKANNNLFLGTDIVTYPDTTGYGMGDGFQFDQVNGAECQRNRVVKSYATVPVLKAYSETTSSVSSGKNMNLAGELVPFTFAAGSISSSAGSVDIPIAGSGASQLYYTLGRPYQIRGITYRLGTTQSSGTMTLTPYIKIDGATAPVSGPASLSVSGTSSVAGSAWQAMGIDSFQPSGTTLTADTTDWPYTGTPAQRQLGLRISTTGFAPTSNQSILAQVWVEFYER